MTRTSYGARLLAPALLLALSGTVQGQAAVFGYRVLIPTHPWMKNLTDPTKHDTIWLSWNHGVSKARGLAPGMTVQRQAMVRIAGHDETVVYPYTLTHDDLGLPKTPPNRVPGGLAGWKANVFVDKNAPSRLIVRPFLRQGHVVLRDSSWAADSVVTLSADELRDLDFYYELRDRQTMNLDYRAFTAGALTIPLRLRPGSTTPGRPPIDQSVASKVGIGLYAGISKGQAQYHFVRGADNVLRDRWRASAVFFLNGSTADADSASSRRAPIPLTRKVTFATISPGFGGLLSVKGVDLGLFLGWEYGVGSPHARSWDYQGRPWYGIGLGYQVFSKS